MRSCEVCGDLCEGKICEKCQEIAEELSGGFSESDDDMNFDMENE